MTWLHWLGSGAAVSGQHGRRVCTAAGAAAAPAPAHGGDRQPDSAAQRYVGRLLPLPEALHHLAAGAPEPLSTQYAALADGITDGGRPFSESWAAAFQALDMLAPDVRAALLTLGEQLGKYDAQLQRRALDTLASRHCRLLRRRCRRTRHSAANSFAASARRLVCSPPWLCFDYTGGAYGR